MHIFESDDASSDNRNSHNRLASSTEILRRMMTTQYEQEEKHKNPKRSENGELSETLNQIQPPSQSFGSDEERKKVVLEFSSRCPEFKHVLENQFPADWLYQEKEEEEEFDGSIRGRKKYRSPLDSIQQLRKEKERELHRAKLASKMYCNPKDYLPSQDDSQHSDSHVLRPTRLDKESPSRHHRRKPRRGSHSELDLSHFEYN
eukprot:119647_1